jgi:VWFA-related protein
MVWLLQHPRCHPEENAMPRLSTALTIALAVSVSAGQQEPVRDSKRQPFRTGAHYVRVDAYPTRDGRPIIGLTADDFELLEDGRPQTIDRVEFIDHPAWTPLGERRDPNSQRDGFRLAQDPNYRVFVLYLDAFHVDFSNSVRTKVPITELLNRMMGPQDLFGVLTPAQTVRDLLLGQLTLSIQEQLEQLPFWGIQGRYEPQPGEAELEFVFPADGPRLVALRRLDKVYSDLEELVATLGNLRDERKNVIFFSDSLVSPPSRFRDIAVDPNRRGRGNPPGIGVDDTGTLTMGSRNAADPDRLRLEAERSRLLSIDFDRRFRDLLRLSRQANVAFYTVRPGGLDVNSSLMNNGTSNLRVLADETDGIAVLASNDLRSDLGKVADDLSSHYVLGYYTDNTRWDGQPRRLTVRLKTTGQTIRARREYRAPTDEEMASITSARSAASAPAAPSLEKAALSALARFSPSARVQAYGAAHGSDVAVVVEVSPAEAESGRWRQGADVEVLLTSKSGESLTTTGRIEPGSRGAMFRLPAGADTGPWQAVVKVRGEDPVGDADTVGIERAAGPLLGKPLAYRAASAAAAAYRPAAIFHFRRTERVRLEWPLLDATASHEGRLLDRNGNPLAVPVATATREEGGSTLLRADLNLAPLGIGEYLIDVTATAGDTTERQVVAIRVWNAR